LHLRERYVLIARRFENIPFISVNSIIRWSPYAIFMANRFLSDEPFKYRVWITEKLGKLFRYIFRRATAITVKYTRIHLRTSRLTAGRYRWRSRKTGEQKTPGQDHRTSCSEFFKIAFDRKLSRVFLKHYRIFSKFFVRFRGKGVRGLRNRLCPSWARANVATRTHRNRATGSYRRDFRIFAYARPDHRRYIASVSKNNTKTSVYHNGAAWRITIYIYIIRRFRTDGPWRARRLLS